MCIKHLRLSSNHPKCSRFYLFLYFVFSTNTYAVTNLRIRKIDFLCLEYWDELLNSNSLLLSLVKTYVQSIPPHTHLHTILISFLNLDNKVSTKKLNIKGKEDFKNMFFKASRYFGQNLMHISRKKKNTLYEIFVDNYHI
jgi:DNA replication protein DnaD